MACTRNAADPGLNVTRAQSQPIVLVTLLPGQLPSYLRVLPTARPEGRFHLEVSIDKERLGYPSQTNVIPEPQLGVRIKTKPTAMLPRISIHQVQRSALPVINTAFLVETQTDANFIAYSTRRVIPTSPAHAYSSVHSTLICGIPCTRTFSVQRASTRGRGPQEPGGDNSVDSGGYEIRVLWRRCTMCCRLTTSSRFAV
ncbi:hypothetical protein FB451DRAFT_1262800 [Mycena latifolia]|nr:hypothetical protein FB451DRAFT_1262800 [Mycena latifolia]